MATIRVHGKVEGLPEGVHPLVVVELLVPATGGHVVGGVAVADAHRRFAVDAVAQTQDWRQGESVFLRTSVATNSGLMQAIHANFQLNPPQVSSNAVIDLALSLPGNCTLVEHTMPAKSESACGATVVFEAALAERAGHVQPCQTLNPAAHGDPGPTAPLDCTQAASTNVRNEACGLANNPQAWVPTTPGSALIDRTDRTPYLSASYHKVQPRLGGLVDA